MTVLLLSLFLVSTAHAQDVPYYPRVLEQDQDRGALNQNLRDLADRSRDQVNGADVPKDTCYADQAWCVDSTNLRVGIGTEYPAYGLDVKKAAVFSETVVVKSSFTLQGGLFGLSAVISTASVPAGTSFTNTALGPCYSTVTLTAPEAGVMVVGWAGATYGSGVTAIRVSALLDSTWLPGRNATNAITATQGDLVTTTSFSEVVPVAAGIHRFCLTASVGGGTGYFGATVVGYENQGQFFAYLLR